MELWIRSQDKISLFKPSALNILYLSTEKEYIILNDYNISNIVGVYKTKERALEVLDEIQHRLITLCDSMNRHLYVYEMPKE